MVKKISTKKVSQHKEPKHAGFWLRLIAYIIDAAILGVINSGVIFLLFALSASSWVETFLFISITWCYYAFMESSSFQATPGKLIVGIYVTDLKGNKISFGKASARFFGKYVSAAILFIGFFMIAFDEKKQGLHDKMARCLVERKE